METSIADWSAGGSVPPTLSWSNTRAQDGVRSLRIQWGTGGVLPLAQTTVRGLTVGQEYTISAYGYVPTGDPGLAMAVGGIGAGSAMTVKNAFTRFSHTFTATDSEHLVQVWPDTSPTSGDECWVDAVQVWEGSTLVAFTMNPAADTAKVRAELLNIGDKVVITNPPDWLPPEDISQLAQGFTETLTRFEWLIDVNCSPASPWDVAVYDEDSGPGEARYSPDSSVTDEVLDTTETAISVVTTGPIWSDADAPFDIIIGGERMTVTAVTGATSAQTLSVTRSVNGVVKTHSTGADVRLFKPAYYAL